MVITILIIVIALLLCFIGWMFKEFFIIVPRGEELIKDIESKPIPEPKTTTSSSIVGITKSVPLVAPPPKPKAVPKAQLPPEEVEDAFLHVEFSTEYVEPNEEEIPEEEIPEEEQTEVVDTEEQIGLEENIKIDRKLCIDYNQMVTSVRKVTRGEQLSIENAEALQKLVGTDIDTKLQQLLPTYQAIVAERLSHSS